MRPCLVAHEAEHMAGAGCARALEGDNSPAVLLERFRPDPPALRPRHCIRYRHDRSPIDFADPPPGLLPPRGLNTC